MNSSNIPLALEIDRTHPFDPGSFFGLEEFGDPDVSVSIWRGPFDPPDAIRGEKDGLHGVEEQDARSLLITKLDPTRLFTQTGFKNNERSITGEERRARLLLEAMQADAKIGETLYREEGQTTLKWLRKTLNVRWLEFLGTTFLFHLNGRRYSLCLFCDGKPDDDWCWGVNWLGYPRGPGRKALGIHPH